jgi:hypothetical protein
VSTLGNDPQSLRVIAAECQRLATELTERNRLLEAQIAQFKSEASAARGDAMQLASRLDALEARQAAIVDLSDEAIIGALRRVLK